MRTIQDRLCTAYGSSNLMHKAEVLCDVDMVAVSGMVGIREPAAIIFYRLKYANDASAHAEALAIVRSYVLRVARKRARQIEDNSELIYARFAKKVLDYWLYDVCPSCAGSGFKKHAFAPYLTDMPCPNCVDGRLLWRDSDVWHDMGRDVLLKIEHAERRGAGMAMAKLARDMDL